MTKDGALACLKSNNYSQAEVRNLINQIDVRETVRKPKYLKKYDIYLNDCGGGKNSSGQVKMRPCVIIKILDDCVLSIPLTSVDNCLALYKSSYRFGQDGYFTKQVVTVPKEYAMANFCGIYDNAKAVDKAVKVLKEFLSQNL